MHLRRSIITIALVLFACIAVSLDAQDVKKYDIKSGIITLEGSMSMSGMTIPSKVMLYFDKYGMNECQETYKRNDESGQMVIADVVFVKDGIRYMYSVGQKTGVKMKNPGRGVAARWDMGDLTPKMKTEFAYKELPSQTICGKTCTVAALTTSYGVSTNYGWNHILLRYDLDNDKMGMKSSSVATKVEENVAIPESKFTPPPDVVFQER